MKLSFGQLFRLVFVLFSLFIMGDAFYRWDGFSYYSTFSEFIPSVALVFILWSMVALIAAIFIWVFLKTFGWLCRRIGFNVSEGNVLIFLSCFLLLGIISWYGKRHIVEAGLTFQLKLLIVACVSGAAAFLTWMLRGKLKTFIENITPLVWLFGLLLLFSVPVTGYYTWIKDGSKGFNEAASGVNADMNRPNIILVTFDALATRNMSLYGYDRQTTPFIADWAGNATVFTNTKAEDGYTTPTTASLMTGKRLWTHRTYHQRSAIHKGEIENIALLLKNNGYFAISYAENKNGSPVSLNIHKSFNVFKSYIPEEQDILSRIHTQLYDMFFGRIKLYDWLFLDDFAPMALFKKTIYYPLYYQIYKEDVWEEKGKMPVSSVSLLDRFISDMESNQYSEPYFAWIHLMPPHEPYLPPEPFMGTFDPSPELRTLDQQFNFRRRASEYIENTGRIAPDDLELFDTYLARYDENILFCDKEFEDFISSLSKRNNMDDTIIILSADHGEIFEHNSMGHGGVFYEPVLNIPLVIKLPGQAGGRIVNDIVEQIDIPATILDLAGLSLPSWVEGRSLTPLLYDKKLQPRPAFSMHLEANRRRGHKIDKGIFAVWENDYKLIYYLETGEALLFNLAEDPEEENNIYSEAPETGDRLVSLLQDRLREANSKILSGQ